MSSPNEAVLLCYRGACDSPADPRGYNRVTHGLYCLPCARQIDRFSRTLEMYPLLHRPLPDGGSWVAGQIAIRDAQVKP